MARPAKLITAVFVILSAYATAGCDTGNALREEPIGAAPGSQFPHLAQTPAGDVVLSWIADTDGGHELQFTRYAGGRWSSVRSVASGNNWLVNWADFPSVVPITDTFWVAHWLVLVGTGYAYHAHVAVSTDAGVTWSAATRLHTDDSSTEHGFVSFFPLNGNAGAVWLDGRNGADGMTLQSAVITPQGTVTAEQVVDPRVCDCCQTDAVASGRQGGRQGMVVYRNRSQTEIRDIYLARSSNGDWAVPEPVAMDGWQITGCPVNGPAVDALDSTVAVAWYTAAQSQPRIRFARSSNGGEFSPPQEVASGGLLGRVDVVQATSGDSFISWMAETERGGAVVKVRRIDTAAQPGAPLALMETATSRPAGFPRMLLADDRLYFAWTDVSRKPNVVRAATVSLDQVPSGSSMGGGRPTPNP